MLSIYFTISVSYMWWILLYFDVCIYKYNSLESMPCMFLNQLLDCSKGVGKNPTPFGTSESPRLDRRVVVVNLARCRGNHPHWCGSPAFRSWPGSSFRGSFCWSCQLFGNFQNFVRSKWCSSSLQYGYINPHPDFFLKKGDSNYVSGFHHTRHPHVRPRSPSNATSQMSSPGLVAQWLEVWDHGVMSVTSTKLVDRSVIES